MQISGLGKQKVKKACTLLLGFSIIFLGLVFCGFRIPNYTYSFKVSSGLCQGQNATPVAGEQILDIAVVAQSNITICVVRASDGTVLRHYDLPIHGDIVGQSDGFLYVLERSDAQGDAFALCAIHIHEGLVRWCQTQLKNYNTNNINYPSNQLQTANGTLYLRYAYQDENNREQNVLTAVDEQTGQVRWSVHTFQPPTSVNYDILALTPSVVYINASQVLPADQPTPTTTLSTSSVCALRASTGQQLWCGSLALAGLLIGGMTADENTLYVQTFPNATLSALNAADGSLRWQKSFSQGGLFSPPNPPTTPSLLALVHGNIIIQMPDNSTYAQLYALRSSDGQQLWSTSPQNQLVFPSSLAATQTLLYAIDSSGNTHAFNILNGTPLWSYDNSSLQNGQGNYFLVQQNTVYLSLHSRLHAPFILVLNAHDGTPRWACTTNPYLSLKVQFSTPQIDSTYPLCFQQTADVYRTNHLTSLQLLQVDTDQ